MILCSLPAISNATRNNNKSTSKSAIYKPKKCYLPLGSPFHQKKEILKNVKNSPDCSKAKSIEKINKTPKQTLPSVAKQPKNDTLKTTKNVSANSNLGASEQIIYIPKPLYVSHLAEFIPNWFDINFK